MSLLRVGLCPLLTQETLEALNTNGIKTVVDFVCEDVEELAQKCCVSYKVLQSLRRLLLAQYSCLPVSGTDRYDDLMSSVAILPTGCDSLDELLDGGLYTTEVMEVTGAPATGKTQLCLSAAASVMLIAKQNVLYIDTNGAFSSQRLVDVIQARGLSEKVIPEVLPQLCCARSFDIFELLDLLEATKASIDGGGQAFYTSLKLVVVDSVTAVVGPVLGGHQTEGHGLMMQLARSLKMLAVDYSLAVLLTNNEVQGTGSAGKPALGPTWSHVPHSRLVLTHDRPDEASLRSNCKLIRREAKLIKSGRQPINISCNFTINDAGVR